MKLRDSYYVIGKPDSEFNYGDSQQPSVPDVRQSMRGRNEASSLAALCSFICSVGYAVLEVCGLETLALLALTIVSMHTLPHRFFSIQISPCLTLRPDQCLVHMCTTKAAHALRRLALYRHSRWRSKRQKSFISQGWELSP